MALLSNLLSILYPRTCPSCAGYIGEIRAKGEGPKANVFCKECLRNLPRTEQAVIRQNETEMTILGLPSDMARAAKVMHLDRAAAFLFYEKDHPIQHVIHKMKYADRPDIGQALGHQAAIEMSMAGFFDGIDVIIPMPLHLRRMRERGYNQSEFIARGISEVTGIPVDTIHVERVRNTPKQALQKGEERAHNVREAFAVNQPEALYKKHILLVDDLITTGETMRSCLKAMKRFRGAKFSVLALCKAR